LRADRRRPEDADDELVRRIAAAEGPAGEGGAEAQAGARDLLGKLFRREDPLAASTRALAVMHLVDGMTLDEVAREAGLSVSGVRKRLRVLRGRLVELEGV